MTSIITPLAPPAVAPNVTSGMEAWPGLKIGAGTVYYAKSGVGNLFASYVIDGFTNAGTLWNDSTSNASGVLTGYYVYGIVNSGTMMDYSADGNAYGITIASGGDYIINSGKLYAVTEKGNAYAITSWESYQRVTNTGVIAAQALGEGLAGVGDALAIAMFNGGQIVNEAGASILGEGLYGRAILLGRSSDFGGEAQVINHGLIAAQTLNSAHPSVAITFDYLGGGRAGIENDGTIRGDVAIQTNETIFNPFTKGGAHIDNLSGGVIEGALELAAGNDHIVNRGTLTGHVSTGNDNDVFDTTAGSWTGTADLGWNDDTFLGSAAGDVVKGGRNGDSLNGNGGDDLLLGGTGDDAIRGGSGNDGLYGESGKDLIVTQGGDAAYGGDGDDVVRADDLSFVRIDGGAGNDTLGLEGPGIRLDLSVVLASGRLAGIETIALGVDQQVAVRAGDAAALTGASATLVFTGVAGDAVLLVGAWSAGADVTRDGQLFHSYTLGNETVLVGASVTATLGATPGPEFGGLSPVAAGNAAPVAGSVAGGELTSAVQTGIRVQELWGALVVDVDETWSNAGLSFVQGFGVYSTFLNHGTLLATAEPGNAFAAISGNDFAWIVNTGTIRVTGVAGAYVSAVAPMSTAPIVNSGLIEAIADQGRALAVSSGKAAGETLTILENSGTISARSNTGGAIGAQVKGSFVYDAGIAVGTNTGTINAIGGAETIALQIFVGGQFINKAVISASNTAASGAHDAIGVTLYNSGYYVPTTLENRGTITGTTAVQGTGGAAILNNYGTIEGGVSLYSLDDFVRNTGVITGPITLGAGRDFYFGAGAQRQVEVAGGEGDDTLIGRAGDRLDGGAGDDTLQGATGATLIGGAGKDRFVFAGPGTGTIADFVLGTDLLDLSGLAPATVTLSAGVGETIVTATSAAGTLTLHVQGTIAMGDITALPRSGTAGADSLIGGASDSTLLGLAGADILVGMAGSDLLDGGAGNDMMSGGTGDDIYYVDTSLDLLREFADEGYDTIVILPGGEAGLYVRMPVNVERMIGANGGDNALDNVMIGTAGADTLDSFSGGHDQLYGGLGNDSYRVDGLDNVVFENAGSGTDKIYSDTSFYLYANIENLEIGGQDGSFGVGNELANVITGSAYANLLLGGGGNDQIYGGAGSDWIYGEVGNDILFGDYNDDFIDGGAGNDVINGNYGTDIIYGGDGDDILWGDIQGAGDGASVTPMADFNTDTLVGGAGNDVLRGDTLRGDYDLMDGGAGNDSYYVDTYADLTFEAEGGGVDTVYADIQGTGYYLYANVENLVLLSHTPFGVGNDLANRLTGSASANWLLGGAGNDILNGKAGNDVLFGQDGADTFVFETGTGGDTIADFVAGTDRIDLSAFGFTTFAQVQAAMVENGGATAIQLSGSDFIVLQGVANAALHAGDFILVGGSEAIQPIDQGAAVDDGGIDHVGIVRELQVPNHHIWTDALMA